MDKDAVKRAAALLAAARVSGGAIAPLPADCRPETLEEAYQVQAALHEALAKAGRGRLAGYKIGCTSQVMQDYLGIPHPCSGGLYDSSLQRRDAVCRLNDYRRLGLELEIAVELGSDLPPRENPYSQAEAAAAVAAVMGSIEIVDDRYTRWQDMGPPSLVADDFFAAGCVLGPSVRQWDGEALAGEQARLFVDGEDQGGGAGRDILGHPMKALAWLANSISTLGGLKTGHVVTLGSVLQTLWIDRPCKVVARYDSLGEFALDIVAG